MFERLAAALRKNALASLGGALLLCALLAAYANHFHNSFHFDDVHCDCNNAPSVICFYDSMAFDSACRSDPGSAQM
jgi:hypothetical protein